jgi:hypothetical protein
MHCGFGVSVLVVCIIPKDSGNVATPAKVLSSNNTLPVAHA